jgi:hypothetical protein
MEVFYKTELDSLVLGDYFLYKWKQN